MTWTGNIEGIQNLVVKPDGKSAHERLRRIWENNIETDLEEINSEVVNGNQAADMKIQWQAFVITALWYWIL